MNSVMLIGLGAMGVFFAPRLQAYLGKEHFKVIAGGPRKERLETKGLLINGEEHFFNVISPENEKETADLIIMAVKDMQLDQALRDIHNFVGQQTQIMCVMNGIDSEERVAALYGWEHVLYSYMRVSIVMSDGVADFDPDWGAVHFGEADNSTRSPRVRDICNLFDHAHINYVVDDDMIKGIWFKFMCNVGENLTSALLGIPFGAYHCSDYANAIRKKAMGEVLAIAKKKGVNLHQSDMDQQEETILKIPFPNKPSTLQDIEHKRKTEIDMFAGKVLTLGAELDIDTPVNFMYYNGIKVLEERNEGKFQSQ